MAFEAIINEVDQLHGVSTRLEGLAEDHPPVLTELLSIAGNVRSVSNGLGGPGGDKAEGRRRHASKTDLGCVYLGICRFFQSPVSVFRCVRPCKASAIACLSSGVPPWSKERTRCLSWSSRSAAWIRSCYLGPLRFKNCGLVGFVPSACHILGPGRSLSAGRRL